jgi:hypothetical protein
MKAKAQPEAKAPAYGRVLSESDEELERYFDEFAEECGNFLRLLAKLRQLPDTSEEREALEAELYGSLSHLEVHAHELREWWDRLDDEA